MFAAQGAFSRDWLIRWARGIKQENGRTGGNHLVVADR
jgi:hypothetical protein